MKKLTFVIAAAGLMTLAACNKSPEAAAVENAADNTGDAIDNQAEAVEAAADNAANAGAESNLDNTAGALHDQADAVRAAGDNKAEAIDANKH